jgi:hypothetical protein
MEAPSSHIAKVKGKKYKYLQFTTKSLKEWNSLYEIWYENDKKVIPKNIEDLLTPVSLAHLHMGDGGWTGKGIHLSTNNYTHEDVTRLIEILNRKFNLKCTINSNNRIYISVKSAVDFCELVTPHMETGMLYKVNRNLKRPNLSSIVKTDSSS